MKKNELITRLEDLETITDEQKLEIEALKGQVVEDDVALCEQMMYDKLEHGQEMEEDIKRLRDEDDI